MAGEVNGARPLVGNAGLGTEDPDSAAPLVEVELVPGGMGWLVERSAGRGRIWTEWPLAPGTVVRVRSNERTVGDDNTAQILRSELIEVRQGRPPLYEGLLLFPPPRA
ncbi:MAG: hypothetical protein GEV06_17005 [Luteitalea sp.]|nr:hypothetical protein [Luteitalea sp.]